jgi:phosphoribosylglycinamide formyltransferase 1
LELGEELMLKMAVLLSGSGRTLDNFHERIERGTLAAQIQVVISNVKGVLGLTKAERYGYPAFHSSDNAGINTILQDYHVDIVCLAGYLKLYVPPQELARAVINIHPSLIPSFCGDGFYGHHVHSAVKARGCMISGCTVHFANEKYDDGPIILQKSVELAYEDDIDTIASKVFAVECEAFPEAINRVDERGIDFFWQRVRGSV